jgi:hypothetical protein
VVALVYIDWLSSAPPQQYEKHYSRSGKAQQKTTNIELPTIDVFTGILAIATAILAFMAVRQVRDNRAVQRAFVSLLRPQSDLLFDQSGNFVGLRVWVIWKNSGATPASPMRGVFGATWVPPGGEFQFGQSGNDVQKKPFVLGPLTEITSGWIDIAAPHVVATLNKQSRQFIWGWVEYQDIFPGSLVHVSEFCLELSLDGQLKPGECRVFFGSYEEHNRYYDKPAP